MILKTNAAVFVQAKASKFPGRCSFEKSWGKVFQISEIVILWLHSKMNYAEHARTNTLLLSKSQQILLGKLLWVMRVFLGMLVFRSQNSGFSSVIKTELFAEKDILPPFIGNCYIFVTKGLKRKSKISFSLFFFRSAYFWPHDIFLHNVLHYFFGEAKVVTNQPLFPSLSPLVLRWCLNSLRKRPEANLSFSSKQPKCYQLRKP